MRGRLAAVVGAVPAPPKWAQGAGGLGLAMLAYALGAVTPSTVVAIVLAALAVGLLAFAVIVWWRSAATPAASVQDLLDEHIRLGDRLYYWLNTGEDRGADGTSKAIQWELKARDILRSRAPAYLPHLDWGLAYESDPYADHPNRTGLHFVFHQRRRLREIRQALDGQQLPPTPIGRAPG